MKCAVCPSYLRLKSEILVLFTGWSNDLGDAMNSLVKGREASEDIVGRLTNLVAAEAEFGASESPV